MRDVRRYVRRRKRLIRHGLDVCGVLRIVGCGVLDKIIM